MRILTTDQPKRNLKPDSRTTPQRIYSPLGMVTARAAHATSEAVVMRRRHLFIGEDGTRNVAEDTAAFVFSRGRKIVADVGASASAIDALHRDAARHARETAPAPTWRDRRAA